MNPILAAAMYRLLRKNRLERECRSCGNRQTVELEQETRTVLCAKCKKKIPPPKA